jgi:hypothetical protein
MKVEIQEENDDNFSIVNELQENIESETEVSEKIEDTPGNVLKAARPAPIENNSGAGWFSGTSWG